MRRFIIALILFGLSFLGGLVAVCDARRLRHARTCAEPNYRSIYDA